MWWLFVIIYLLIGALVVNKVFEEDKNQLPPLHAGPLIALRIILIFLFVAWLWPLFLVLLGIQKFTLRKYKD